ncbi:ABC transporter permease [Pengzhenrongella frigida]|uniref:ABC transporter permease n=1 Tax=Pengzhenrongella frigida TaxID=1259133 RepID=A0A4Q5N791_9MICO|nr:ABC transporter permease [Cellulomonas sp. HLT2-17]RYV52977.1 ABC transporter permease [Cellulomonas sp. HLT2-17]
MAQHNLSTVIGFEFLRVVTKKRFWLTSLAVPLALAVVFALVFLSNAATSETAQAQADTQLVVTYTDDSGLITDAVAAAFGGSEAPDPAAAIAAVKDGTVDAYFAYPADPSTQPIRVYGVDKGIFENGAYAAVATQMLVLAAQQEIDAPELAAVVQGDVTVTSETYRDGVVSGGLDGVIPPLLFLVVFYVSIILLGNQMLNSTLEEKENRVTEMILTTMNPTTLIVGKVLSLFMVGLVQMLTFAVPVVVGYLFFRSNLNLPDVDLSHLSFEPGAIVVGTLLLLGGFILFTGTLVAIGAMVPTAKEAGTFFAPLMIMIFVPFYVVSLIVSDPRSLIVQVFTYFPYTAPVTAMLRNSFGSLSALESGIVIVELFALGFVALRLAVYLFRYGSIAYSKRLSLRDTLRRSRA